MPDSEYIKWVQRSLNYDGAQLAVNGMHDQVYLDSVATYKSRYSVKDGLLPNQVGSKCQDVMIRNNWVTPAFQDWLHSVLPDAMQGDENAMTSAVRNFQKSVKINVDGFVGSKTEAALISSFQKKPEDKPIPKPQPSQDPLVKWFNTLTNGQRYDYVANLCALYYSTHPCDPELRALAKFLTTSAGEPIPRYFYIFTRQLVVKLKNAQASDLAEYIYKGWYRWYIRIDDNVAKTLMDSYMEPSSDWAKVGPFLNVGSREQLDQYVQDFIRGVRELHVTIVDGIGTIAYWSQFVGEQATLKLGKNLVVGLAKLGNKHLYSCYASRMPNEWWDSLTFPH